LTHNEKVSLIDRDHAKISIVRQADLLDISRSSIYYVPRVHGEDIRIMNHIDEIYTACPFYGSRRMKWALKDDYEISICRDRVRRLMRIVGIEAIYPKKKHHTSIGDKFHKKYPYLLNGVKIIHPNQVWGTDITYVRLADGWAYLTAILDWFSRFVIAWTLSSTLETTFCIEVLKDALLIDVPDMHNSDQGVQYTSEGYTGILQDHGIKISMDSRGRCFDNIFTERLWRTVKYENIYLHSYRDIDEARTGLTDYFTFYNTKRGHQSLDYRTPADMYFDR
jgi:putative transposase